jgi:uncharacterized protein with PIN domain
MIVVDTSAIVAIVLGVASARGLPLLFKGNDFAKTDIIGAVTVR